MVNTGIATGYMRSEQSLLDQAESEGENEATEAGLNAIATAGMIWPGTGGVESVAVVGGVTAAFSAAVRQWSPTEDNNSNQGGGGTLPGDGLGNLATTFDEGNPVRDQATEMSDMIGDLGRDGHVPSQEVIDTVQRALSPSANDGEVATSIFHYYNDRADMRTLRQTEEEAFFKYLFDSALIWTMPDSYIKRVEDFLDRKIIYFN